MKKLLSVLLATIMLLTCIPLGTLTLPVSAAEEAVQEDLESIFQQNLNFLDQYYTLGAEFMIQKLCGILYPWEEAEALGYASVPTPADELEALLNLYFAPTEQQMADIRNYPIWDSSIQGTRPFYNTDTGMYEVFFVGGFGGTMPEREYQRYIVTENGYTVFYQHITYEELPIDETLLAELEALGWPATYTYNGYVYENGPDGYLRVVSRDDYGNKYEVQYNDGILRILSQAPYTAAPESDFEYEILDGEAIITGYNGSGGDVIIPMSLGGYPVTAIGIDAFWCCTSLISVTIPDSVTTIGEYAFFSCDSLTSVTIPDSVTTIGSSAFYKCTSLTSVTIGDSVTVIGDDTFYYCTSLTSVIIGDSVTTIGYRAFDSCDSLTAIEVDEDNANYCSVDGVLFNKDKTTIVQYPRGKKGSYSIPDSVTTIGDYAFYCCTSLTSVTIGNSVTTIGYEAFSYCTSLTSVTIGDSVTAIGDYTFYYCTSLTSAIIGDSVTTIGRYAFYKCTSLTAIEVDEDNANFCSVDGVLFNKDKTTLIYCPGGKKGSYSIPDSVTTIGDWAFNNCTSLTSVTIPDSVTAIGERAFYGCTSLTSVTIPDSVITIGNRAFYECTSLTSVTIPDSVTTIGSSAFYYCISLTSVTIPDSVTTIGGFAFWSCTSLTSVTIPNSVTTIGRGAFEACTSLTAIEVDENNANYCSADGVLFNKDQTTLIQFPGGKFGAYSIPAGVATIDWYAFNYCTSLTSVTIPDSVTTIGYRAFYECTNLTSVTIGNSVTTIVSYAFYNCASLTDVYYTGTEAQATAMDIGDGNDPLRNATWHYAGDFPVAPESDFAYEVYNGEATITDYNGNGGAITIPSALGGYPVTTIGSWAFSGYTNLTSVTIPDSVTTIGRGAFSSCTGLTWVSIPDSVTTIGVVVFEWCTALTAIEVDENNANYSSADGVLFNKDQTTLIQCPGGKVGAYTVPDSVTTIPYNAFNNCARLTSVIIGNSVTTIGDYAFEYCTNLTSVTIPNSVTTIGDYAFLDCASLTTMTIPDSVTTIGDYAFEYCTSLTSLTIPDSVITIGEFAFGGCDNLTAIEVDENNANYCSVDGVLFNKDKTTIVQYPGGKKGVYSIPDSVTTIGDSAFSACYNLNTVIIPDSVTTIGLGAFSNCLNLTSVTIPDSVTGIRSYAFYNCKSLTSVIIPDSVTALEYGVFAWCESLTSISIPESITDIWQDVFFYCTNLTSVILPDSVTYIGDWAFDSCANLTDIYYTGSETQATAIYIGDWNDSLRNATWHCNYIPTCNHDYTAATCTKAKTCTVCGETEGSALGHDYTAATCTKAKTCKTCGVTSGSKLGHDYAAATCTKAKICKTCGATSGSKLGHSYEKVVTKATTSKNGTIKNVCTRCDYTASKVTTIYKASKISLSKTSFTYDGKVQKPTVTVKDSAGNTISSSNYTVTYPSGCKNAGTYKVTVTFKGNYSGTKTLTYKINPIDISKCKITLSATSYTYNGSVKKPTVTVKNANGTKLTTSSYTVTYATGRKNVGTYKVTVKMKGNYTGTKTLTFKINPAKTTVSKLTAGTKKLTVAITKKTTQVTGYQIQYSTSKSFSSYKTKTLTSYKTTSATLTGLKAKTTYYVRVRTYKTVNGVKYYSGWSTVKYFKTK